MGHGGAAHLHPPNEGKRNNYPRRNKAHGPLHPSLSCPNPWLTCPWMDGRMALRTQLMSCQRELAPKSRPEVLSCPSSNADLVMGRWRATAPQQSGNRGIRGSRGQRTRPSGSRAFLSGEALGWLWRLALVILPAREPLTLVGYPWLSARARAETPEKGSASLRSRLYTV